MQGTVKFFNAGKHYGFLKAADGRLYFAHGSDFDFTPQVGALVEFSTKITPRGLAAVKVSFVSEGAGPVASEAQRGQCG